MSFQEPWEVFAACFGVSSVSGLAALLRSGQPLTVRSVISAFLYSGMSGLVIGLLWYNVFSTRTNVFFLIGVSGLAGIGSVSIIDFITQLITGNFGINISFNRLEAERKRRKERADSESERIE